VNLALDFFQWSERGSAGGDTDTGDLRVWTLDSFCCEINQEEGISGCVGMEEDG
jgi:hypothetical protein